MRKVVTTYLCDVCNREFDEQHARETFYNANFTVLKNTWDGEVATHEEIQDVCSDCMNELSRVITNKLDELKKNGGRYGN